MELCLCTSLCAKQVDVIRFDALPGDTILAGEPVSTMSRPFGKTRIRVACSLCFGLCQFGLEKHPAAQALNDSPGKRLGNLSRMYGYPPRL